jgi:hypothetical protein
VKPIVNKKFRLERYPGKGGWTFARIPRIKQDDKRPFGYVKVKGTIDGYEIRKFNLMPMSDGDHFMPVKSEIRKAIQKEAGDLVHIILYHDTDPLEVPGEMLLCLQDEPKALKFFNKLTDSEKKYYIQWVYGAKKEETKINRMAAAINRLMQGLKMYDMAPKDE